MPSPIDGESKRRVRKEVLYQFTGFTYKIYVNNEKYTIHVYTYYKSK
jgi:hypothetical protein